MIFFFSSRRRHTRSYGDWSSDVCSSDLGLAQVLGLKTNAVEVALHRTLARLRGDLGETGEAARRSEIGRASRRERGSTAVERQPVKQTRHLLPVAYRVLRRMNSLQASSN